MASNECPWRARRQCGKDGLSKEIMDFVRFLDLSIEQRKLRAAVVREVRDAVSALWPDATVQVFGSWQSGLCLPSSDVDLNVTTDAGVEDIRRLCHSLENGGMTTKFLAAAKVPIVKFVSPQGVHGDICFNLPHAQQSAELVKKFLRMYPAAKPLIIVLKTILRAATLNNVYSGGVSSYSLTLMVTSFLQMHPYYKNKFQRDRYQLFDLLIDFTAFYGKDFDYHNTTISVLDGGSYLPKIPTWVDRDKPYLLSILDPLDPDNDVSRGSFAICKARMLFYSTYLSLQRTKQLAQRHSVSALGSVLRYSQLVRMGIIPPRQESDVPGTDDESSMIAQSSDPESDFADMKLSTPHFSEAKRIQTKNAERVLRDISNVQRS